MRKNKQNLIFHIINFYFFQNMKKIPWNCIGLYLKISFEKFSAGNPQTQISMQPSVEIS